MGNEFVSVKSLFTIGAIAWHPFVMYGETFLGLADTYGKSIVYQAIGSRFVKYQKISTQWAHGITAFVHGSRTCLVLVTKKRSILTAQYTSSTKYVA